MRNKYLTWYIRKYPLSVMSNKVHKIAKKRTVEHLAKTRGWKVTHPQIDQVLYLMHRYIKDIALNLHKWPLEDCSVHHVHFGYFRVYFPKLFTDMYKAGEFTDQEWKIITEEFYPKQFKIFNELMTNREIWKQQNLK